MVWGRLQRSVEFWRERDEIVGDLQRGRYTVAETVQRLAEHAKPGGQARRHAFSCRNGFLTCREAHCSFAFDDRIGTKVTLQ